MMPERVASVPRKRPKREKANGHMGPITLPLKDILMSSLELSSSPVPIKRRKQKRVVTLPPPEHSMFENDEVQETPSRWNELESVERARRRVSVEHSLSGWPTPSDHLSGSELELLNENSFEFENRPSISMPIPGADSSLLSSIDPTLLSADSSLLSFTEHSVSSSSSSLQLPFESSPSIASKYAGLLGYIRNQSPCSFEELFEGENKKTVCFAFFGLLKLMSDGQLQASMTIDNTIWIA